MKLHWVHADCLDAGWIDPAAGPAVYVFDDRQLEADGWSLQRVGFVYECLLEMPRVEIWRGPLAATLVHLVAERQLDSVVTVPTPDPWLQGQAAQLGAAGVRLEWLARDPFVALSGTVDLRRFSRYWQKAEPLLLHD